MDITKIRSGDHEDPYCIVHSDKGLQIVNVKVGKAYDLCINEQMNFNVCRSIDVQPTDQENPDGGFWLV